MVVDFFCAVTVTICMPCFDWLNETCFLSMLCFDWLHDAWRCVFVHGSRLFLL